jgi:hypothetical protein
MSNNSPPPDQVQGNVDIKRLCKNKYKITFNKISKFLKHQTSSDTSQPLNESCSAYYQNAKQWVKHFNILNKSNISTAIMEIDNNKYLFVIYEAKLNKKCRVVFKVTTKEINFSNDASKIKIPRGCHDNVRFIIESRTVCELQNNSSKFLTSNINVPVTFNQLSTDTIMNVLNGVKTAFDANYYLFNLITKYKDEIKLAGRYDTVLQPIVEKDYIGNEDYFWVTNSPKNELQFSNATYYFTWNQYSRWNNKKLVEIEINDIPSPDLFNNTRKRYSLISSFDALDEKYNRFRIDKWDGSIKLYYTIYILDILDDKKQNWIEIGSCIDLLPYFPVSIQNDISLLPKEFIVFIEYINNYILSMSTLKNEFFSETISTEDIITKWSEGNIWELTPLGSKDNAKCLYSKKYDFTDKYISDCFIPNIDLDYPSIINNVLVDLNLNNRNIKIGQITILTYTIGNISYFIINKIISYNGKTAWIDKMIEINDKFNKSIDVKGDVNINGNLSVNTFNDEPIMNVDNVNRIITLYNKLGINQEPYNVKGVLDIDNLSIPKIISILDHFQSNQTNSYYIITLIIDSILNSNASNTANIQIPSEFNDVSIINAPLKNNILNTDIKLIGNSLSNPFLANGNTLNLESFDKINRITNELNKMIPEINGYKTTNNITGDSPFIYSFTEILTDSKYSYLCSIKAFIHTYNGVEYVYFVISSSNVQDIIINNSYKSNFEEVINKLSTSSKYLNYVSLVIYQNDIYSKLFPTTGLIDTTMDHVNNYINNNDYFRNRFGNGELYSYGDKLTDTDIKSILQKFTLNYDDDGDYGTTILSEQFPVWVNKNIKDIYVPNTELKLSYALYTSLSQIININGIKLNQSFGVYYKWVDGIKYSYLKILYINNSYYAFGVGIDLEKLIDNAIVVKGDSTLTGNLFIKDVDNKPIFQVNNNNKKISNMYSVGIGKEIPTTTLDVADSSVNDILTVVKEMANIFGILNSKLNVNAFKQSNISNLNDISHTIETLFIDPSTNKTFVQTDNKYFAVQKFNYLNDSYKVYKVLYIYNYLLNTVWKNEFGKDFNDITIPETKVIIEYGIKIESENKNKFIFDNSSLFYLYDWVYGKKFSIGRVIKKGDEYFRLLMGVDLENMHIKIKTNSNIETFFNCMIFYQNYLDVIVSKLNKISLNDSQYILAFDNLNNNLLQYGTPKFNKLKIFTDSNNNNHLKSQVFVLKNEYIPNKNSTLDINTDFDYDPASFSSIPVDQYNIYQYLDNNVLIKYQSLILNIINLYKTIDSNDYGIIYYEDLNQYYVGLIYCVNSYTDPDDSKKSYIEIILLEKKIDEIIIPSVKINGDTEINGEITIKNRKLNKNYTIIDPDRKFIGINSDEREIFYTYRFNSETKSNIISQNLHVQNNKYPVSVFERIWEIDYKTFTEKTNPKYKDNIFDSYSALTVKRGSDLYKFKEMHEYALETNVKYGVDIAFEMRNKWYETQEIGHIGMFIDKVIPSVGSDDLTIKAGFKVTATDIIDINETKEKELLYVSNDGDLRVNSIILPIKNSVSLPVNPSVGQIVYVSDNNVDYLYVCTSIAPIKWKRTNLSEVS